MRKILHKMLNNRICKHALYILFYAVIFPITLLGRIIFFISKPIRALGFLLTGNIHSAKEEITEWDMMLNLKDVF